MARLTLTVETTSASAAKASRGHVGAAASAYAHRALLGAALAVLGVTAWAYARGATSYIDNGDGYYLYAARRVAHYRASVC